MLPQDAFATEAALFKHALRSGVLSVAEGVKPRQGEAGRHLHHRLQGFRGKPVSPGVPGEHVAGRGAISRLKGEPCAAQQSAGLPRLNQIRPCGPALPLRFTQV